MFIFISISKHFVYFYSRTSRLTEFAVHDWMFSVYRTWDDIHGAAFKVQTLNRPNENSANLERIGHSLQQSSLPLGQQILYI